MNEMWRPDQKLVEHEADAEVSTEEQAGVPPLPPGDPLEEVYKRGRREWDERIGDAVSQVRSWKAGFFGQLPVTFLCVAGIVYFASQNHLTTLTIVKDRAGDVIDVRHADKNGTVDDWEIGADLSRWVQNARTVDVSVQALRRSIVGAYAYTAKSSPAYAELSEFHRNDEPFAKARTNIVEVLNVTALPVNNTPDSEGQRVWRLSWSETTRNRDGSMVTQIPWEATVTFVVTPSQDETIRKTNPDGVYVVNYSWRQNSNQQKK